MYVFCCLLLILVLFGDLLASTSTRGHFEIFFLICLSQRYLKVLFELMSNRALMVVNGL